MQGKNIKAKPSSRSNKRKQNSLKNLPAIPDKRYFTISEVSQLCAVKAYVLRYWEQEFPQLKPVKRRGNRRYYQVQDILLVRQIQKLLYDDGFTIEGARSQLTNAAIATVTSTETISQSGSVNATVRTIIEELENVLQSLQMGISTSH